MKQLMIMCTCAENNGHKYLQNIREWYSHLEGIDADFYVINDGVISEEELKANNISSKINFVNLSPKLGRQNLSIFPGFCRSLSKGLEISQQYKYFAHIENDIKILNIKKLRKYLYKDGIYIGFSKRYLMIESSLMLVNNLNVRNRISEYYSNAYNQNKDHDVEVYLESELKKEGYEIAFIGERFDGAYKYLLKSRDYIAQYKYEFSPLLYWLLCNIITYKIYGFVKMIKRKFL